MVYGVEKLIISPPCICGGSCVLSVFSSVSLIWTVLEVFFSTIFIDSRRVTLFLVNIELTTDCEIMCTNSSIYFKYLKFKWEEVVQRTIK